jgi:UDP-N-acetylmuramoylalanine--D-glutamate ligase
VSIHPDALRGRRVLVLGLGSFGGGSGVARALARRGARVTVTDLRPIEQLDEARAELAGLPVAWEVGGHREELFAGTDVVVVNPAVPAESPWLAVARRHGCALTTDVNLALAQAAGVPAFAVTGTHGKSTCASLAAHLLGALPGRTILAGNLGGSLLGSVVGLGPEDRLVVELSSFQTEALDAPPGWPRVAALTCLRSDHLDRHGTREAYAAAKRRLLEFQDADGIALLPAGDPESAHWSTAARGTTRTIGPERLAELGLRAEDLPFREPYRLSSALAAIEAALLLGLPAGELRARLAGFRGLPHRMEELPVPAGFRVVDNGVATHPEPTEAALRHAEGAVVLIAGGKDKGLPLDGLADAARGCARVYLHGEGGRRLAAALHDRAPLHYASSRAAFDAALEGLQAGETLLFSPSFASFDEYRNFKDRATVFRDRCRMILGRRAADSVANGAAETR